MKIRCGRVFRLMATTCRRRIICRRFVRPFWSRRTIISPTSLCQKMQGLFAEAFQVVGSLHVDCTHTGSVTEYRRELDLASAVATTRYKVGDVVFERAAFASAPDQAIVFRVSASRAGQLNATIWMDGRLVTSVKPIGRQSSAAYWQSSKACGGRWSSGQRNSGSDVGRVG